VYFTSGGTVGKIWESNVYLCFWEGCTVCEGGKQSIRSYRHCTSGVGTSGACTVYFRCGYFKGVHFRGGYIRGVYFRDGTSGVGTSGVDTSGVCTL
jgi:hypothetical protein